MNSGSWFLFAAPNPSDVAALLQGGSEALSCGRLWVLSLATGQMWWVLLGPSRTLPPGSGLAGVTSHHQLLRGCPRL